MRPRVHDQNLGVWIAFPRDVVLVEQERSTAVFVVPSSDVFVVKKHARDVEDAFLKTLSQLVLETPVVHFAPPAAERALLEGLRL